MAFELSFEQEEFLRSAGFDPDAPDLPGKAAPFLGERAREARTEDEREFYERILSSLCRFVKSAYGELMRSFPDRRRRIARPWMRREQAVLLTMAGGDPDEEIVPESVFDVLDDGALYAPSAQERALCAELAQALRQDTTLLHSSLGARDALEAARRLHSARGANEETMTRPRDNKEDNCNG